MSQYMYNQIKAPAVGLTGADPAARGDDRGAVSDRAAEKRMAAWVFTPAGTPAGWSAADGRQFLASAARGMLGRYSGAGTQILHLGID
jgi:hypothetical protein